VTIGDWRFLIVDCQLSIEKAAWGHPPSPIGNRQSNIENRQFLQGRHFTVTEHFPA